MKNCTKCGVDKPQSDFYGDKRATDGLCSRCKPCHRAATEASRKKKPEEARQRQRDYRKRNAERLRERDREYRRANPEKFSEYKRRYRDRHPEKVVDYNRAYYEANADAMRARSAKWREENPEQRKAQRDPEKNAIYRLRRRSRLLDAYVEDVHLDDLLVRDLGRCGICDEPIMESPEVDHIVPLSRGGTHENANCQLAHLLCNRRKATRLDYEHRAEAA